jgi:hypothetical protein
MLREHNNWKATRVGANMLREHNDWKDVVINWFIFLTIICPFMGFALAVFLFVSLKIILLV